MEQIKLILYFCYIPLLRDMHACELLAFLFCIQQSIAIDMLPSLTAPCTYGGKEGEGAKWGMKGVWGAMGGRGSEQRKGWGGVHGREGTEQGMGRGAWEGGD